MGMVKETFLWFLFKLYKLKPFLHFLMQSPKLEILVGRGYRLGGRDWRRTKELGRGWHRLRKNRKREKRAFCFSSLPLSPVEKADLQPWFGGGGEHKEDRSAVLPSECLGT